jgi:hypothetical protein
MSSASLGSLMSGLALLAFVVGGFAVMFRATAFAIKALLLGVALAAAAGLAPSALARIGGMSPVTLFICLSAAAGIVALLRRHAKLAFTLLWPAVSNWALWPILWPYVRQDWPLVLMLVAPFSLFIMIWLLQKILRPIYGAPVADHVAGTYVVRAVDASGRSLGRLVGGPFRLAWGALRRR